jgi:hypothetical protein
MANLRGFDANQVEPSQSLDPLPAAQYLAVITDSEFKSTKANTGSYLQLTFEVIEGAYKGRKLWARLNLDNPNAQAVAIAKAELSAICRAVGVLAPNDSTELHNLPLVIKVGCKKRNDTGEITNEIKGYSKKESAPPTPAANGQGHAVQPQVPSTPPWKRP